MTRHAWLRLVLFLAAILALSMSASVALADDDKPDPGPAVPVDDPPALYTYTVTRPAQTFDTSFGSQLGYISACDDCAQRVTLPFTFNFYGYNYTSVWATSNGLLNFTFPDPQYANSIGGLRGKIAIAPAWDDWYNPGPGAVYYRGDANQVVFTWVTPHFPYANGGIAEFQAVLYSDGRIQFNYRANNAPTSATLGISTADTNVSTAYAVDVGSTNMMQGYLFTPGGQANQPPTVSANNGTVVVNEGQPASNTGAYSDANAGDNVTLAASVGAVTKTGTNSGTWSWSFNTTDGPAQSQAVTITANDGKGGTASATFQLTVNNVVPTATFNAPASVNEGSPINLSLTGASDPSSADMAAGLSYAFDCGSGYGAFGAASGASCPTTDNGTRAVKGKVRDKDGGESEYSASVTINNVAPTVNAGADATIFSGQSVSLSAGFSDPGVNDAPWSYTVDWGDGPSSSGTSSTQGAGQVTGSHQYFVPGAYTVKVCVTDKDGGKGCDELIVEVKRLLVRIDIKPGSDPNSINLRSRGNVPVGVFSGIYNSINVDATTIDRASLLFAHAPALAIGTGPQDLNGDGRLDMVFHFDTQALNLTSASTQGCLTGRTAGNVYFEGCDSVRIVP